MLRSPRQLPRKYYGRFVAFDFWDRQVVLGFLCGLRQTRLGSRLRLLRVVPAEIVGGPAYERDTSVTRRCGISAVLYYSP